MNQQVAAHSSETVLRGSAHTADVAASPARTKPKSRLPSSTSTTSPWREVHVALLGRGTVGGAVLERLDLWKRSGFAAHIQLVHVANSREAWRCPPGMNAETRSSVLRTLSPTPLPSAHVTRAAGEGLERYLSNPFPHESSRSIRILIDATPSDAIGARHADWLARGIHVVTACKLARGTSLAQWRAIEEAQVRGHTQYGDAATVGAGLPILRSLRGLQAGGDRIHSIAGVLSGSLAWLFNQYDGMRPFSALVRQAREAGYTEPDPREDLSGEDVRRKLLILARAAGVELEADEVRVDSLVPSALSVLPLAQVDDSLAVLDAPMRARFAQAWKAGEVLRFVARLEGGKARVGLESLQAAHPLAGGAGTDNRVAIHSDRYHAQPLVIQGPGAGAQVTAAALLDDVLRIARSV